MATAGGGVAQDVSSLSRLAGGFAIDFRWAWSILMAAPVEDNQRGGTNLMRDRGVSLPSPPNSAAPVL